MRVAVITTYLGGKHTIKSSNATARKTAARTETVPRPRYRQDPANVDVEGNALTAAEDVPKIVGNLRERPKVHGTVR